MSTAAVASLAAALALSTAPDYQALLENALQAHDTPGVSAVVSHGDDILFAGGAGLADVESGKQMTADTVLYAGSLSKVFTAVMVLQLVERGELALARPVSGIAEQRANPATITVAHLLTHASGLRREGDFGYWFSGEFPDRDQLFEYLSRTTLRSEPGAELHYSNLGYARLGAIIEDTMGGSFAEALSTLLATPLGLRATGVPGPAAGVATGYSPSGRIIPSRERPFAGIGRRVGTRHVREYHDAAAMSPAFGIYTSANDLGTLGRFLLGKREHELLSTVMRRRMRTRQPSGWGLGLKVGRLQGNAVARHEGWFAAHRSHLLLDAGRRLSIVVLTNSDGGAPALIAEVLYESALKNTSGTGGSP